MYLKGIVLFAQPQVLPRQTSNYINTRKRPAARVQDCQIFLGTTYQNGKNIPNDHKYTRWPQNIPNGRKIKPMAIKYTYIFNCKTLQNLPTLVF
jgi:hypothetical protein